MLRHDRGITQRATTDFLPDSEHLSVALSVGSPLFPYSIVNRRAYGLFARELFTKSFRSATTAVSSGSEQELSGRDHLEGLAQAVWALTPEPFTHGSDRMGPKT